MKKILILALILSSIILTSCESETEKLAKVEAENILEEKERQDKLEKAFMYAEKREKDFLETLNKSELNIYNKYSPDYVVLLYKNNNVYKKIFTHDYPEDKYFWEPWKCIEYNNVLNWIKRNKEVEFCRSSEQSYEIKNLRFYSNY